MPNVWAEEWDWESADPDAPAGYDVKAKRLVGGDRLGVSLYEIPAGATQAPYHFHHGSEEILVALRGRLTLRTPSGERELEEGEVAHFPPGPEGAHEQLNRTDEAVRYLVAGTRVLPEVAEYPDLGQITAQSRHPSQQGEPLFVIHDLPAAPDDGSV